ncbi:MAG: drug resistance transporter [Acidimicrobiales bacterium]|nr:drug resistance transporter [Acidimicrobiales bacterium]
MSEFGEVIRASGAGPVTPPDPQADRIHERRWLTLAVLCLSLVLIVAGNSSLNVALPDIQTRLGSSPSSLQWIADVYGLVFAGLLLPAGALADRFGRKTALQGGLVLFAASAMVATFGTQTWHLIVARGVMGVGAAFIMPGTLSILSNVFEDPVERRRAISIWAGFAGLGGAVGTLVSGFVLEEHTWSSTFLVNVPICAVALVAGLWLVPNSSDPTEAVLDPRGAVLAVAGLGTLLYAIIEAPAHGWASPETLGASGAALVLLTAFVWWELRCDHPMLDVRLFGNRSFAIGSSTITLQYMAMFGLYFALAQYLQFAHGYSALETALIALPIGVFAMIGAPLSARNVARFGPRRVVGSGLLVSGTGLLVLALTSSATVPVAVIIAGFALVGLGNGQTTAPSTTLIMGSVPRAKSGVGSAVNDLSRELGGALGIAVLGSAMSSIYRSEIAGRLTSLPATVQARARSSIVATLDAAEAAGRGGDTRSSRFLLDQGRAAFGSAFGRTMLMATVVIFVNAAIVWTFQGRHRGAVAPAPTAVGPRPTPDGSDTGTGDVNAPIPVD